ncbi:MAG TPA: glycosyltransferase family 9 protein [Melioribacteraceae bacterium]|nr:glycosyltransferase family 9 protein [Melioribacteraceae bacterium]
MKNTKILIIRTDRIGDITLTLPLAAEIKKYNPQYSVHFLVTRYTKPLVELNKHIDKIYCIEDFSFLKLLTLFSKEKFNYVLNVYPRAKFAWVSFLAMVEHRIGTGYRWYSFLFNKKVYEHRKSGEKHELEYNFALLKYFDIKHTPDYTGVDFSIQPTDNDLLKVEDIFTEFNLKNNNPIIIIHPGSGGSAIDLPIERMKELIILLAQSLKFNIILTGSNAEKELCESLTVSKNVLNFSGKFNLNELVALISKTDLLIANSTGPIHLAAALNKYTVGFYPKFNECSAKRWGPYTNKKFIFEPEIDCKNCNRKQCESLGCMKSIDVKKVYKTINKIFYSGEEL